MSNEGVEWIKEIGVWVLRLNNFIKKTLLIVILGCFIKRGCKGILQWKAEDIVWNTTRTLDLINLGKFK